MLVLALDVGTSSARARAFDADGRAHPGAEGQVTYEPRTTPDGGVELDADALLAATADALDACLAGCGARAAEIAAVGVSVFWHSLLALDRARRPITPVITWADTRSAAAALALRRAHDERRIHARTGAPLHPAFFPAKLRWLREARPDVFARAATWCGFGEYLQARLTGRLGTSLSMASGTGLLDQIGGGWDQDMLAVAGLPTDALPPIDDTAAPGLVAPHAARWPALARVPWHPARGDGACSNVGSDCRDPRRVALNVGTSAALRVVLPEPPGPHAATPWGLWRYRVDAARALVGGATSEGGNVLAWCRKSLALPRSDAALEDALGAVAPDGHGLTALPFLAGERSPGWRPDARAAIAGLSLGTGAVEIARALLEGVAFRLAEVYDRLRPLAAPDHVVVASGGALAHSPVWAQIVTDALGIPVTFGRDAEASARGAALLALEALGVPAPEASAPLRILRPTPDHHARYRAARERQRHLYDNIVGFKHS
ncbi:MAG: gluconokinase [Phycisphaerales bacterium]